MDSAYITQLEKRIAPFFSTLRSTGLPFDVERANEARARLGAFATHVAAFIVREGAQHGIVGSFNPNSSPQVAKVLYDNMELRPLKETGKGARSTDADALSVYRHIPLVNAILTWREVNKQRQMYASCIELTVDGRLYPVIDPNGQRAGRVSTKNPNCQNLPNFVSWTVDGVTCVNEFRRCIREEGKRVLVLDFSQIESRILAGVSKCVNMIYAFTQGVDLHRQTAAFALSIPAEDVTQKQRDEIGKVLNHALGYGMGVAHLYRTLEGRVSYAEAEAMHARFHAAYPELEVYRLRKRDEVQSTMRVESFFGREILIVPGELRGDGVERVGVNNYCQATAADLFKRYIRKLHDSWALKFLTSVATVHDALVFTFDAELPDVTLENVCGYLRELAEELTLDGYPPFTIDIKVGESWGELTKR